MEWPFKLMQVGETRVIYDVDPVRAQVTAHAYGKSAGKRFKTAKVREPDGRVGLAVKRLKGAADPDTAPPRGPARVQRVYGFEHLKVGESVEFWGHEAAARVMGSIQRVEGRTGMKFKRKTATTGQQYLHLTLTRVA